MSWSQSTVKLSSQELNSLRKSLNRCIVLIGALSYVLVKHEQELSYRKQIAHQLRTQVVEGI